MPNIKAYDAPALGLNPSEIGVHAAEGAGRRGGAFYNQAAGAYQQLGHDLGGAVRDVGDVALKHIESQEIATGSRMFAELQANQIEAWNNKIRDPKVNPSDPTIAGQFHEQLENTLQNFKESFLTEGGQKFAEAQTEKLRSHMFLTTASDMSRLSGIKVQSDVTKTIDALSRSAFDDPSSLEHSRGTLKDSLDAIIDSNPMLSPAAAATVRNSLMYDGERKLVRSAIAGVVEKGGDWQRLVNDPRNKQYLDVSDIERLNRRADTDAQVATTALQKDFETFVTREASGLSPPPGEWERLRATAARLPDGGSLLAIATAKRTLAAKLQNASVDQADNIMSTLRDDYRSSGGVDETRADLIRFGDKLVTEDRRLMRADLLGAGQKQGRIGSIAPLDFEGFSQTGNGDAFATQVRNRATQAQAVAASMQRQPQYFRPEEKERLKEVFDGGGDTALKLVAAIVKGGGEQAPAMLHQLGDEAPKLVQAGVILSSGGSLPAARDLAAFQALKGRDLQRISDTDQSGVDAATLGQAYYGAPSDGIRVKAAAESIARVRVAKEGIDAKADSKRAREIYDRSLKEASGGVFVEGEQYGGAASYSTGWFGNKAQVIAPAGVKASSFRSLITAISDEDLKALPNPPMKPDGAAYSMRDLTDKIPVKVAGGYRFASKSYAAGGEMRYVTDRTGAPWVLDWNAIEPALRQRVPGAFLGQP